MTSKLTSVQFIEFEKCLFEWIILCPQVVIQLNSLADDLDEHFLMGANAKIGGATAGIVGGVMGFVGFGLSFVTFGASLGLSIAGGVIAGAGGSSVGWPAATDAILSRAAKELIRKYNTKLDEVKNRYLEIHVELQKRAELSNLGSRIEEKFPHWIKFWWNLVIGADQVGWSTGGSIIYTTIKSSFQLETGLDDATITVFFPLDIFTMVDSAIDVHKKNPLTISYAMRKLAIQIEKECPKKDSIQTMIAETLKQLE